MSSTDNLEIILQSIGIDLPQNIRHDIAFNLQHNNYPNKHFAFIIDLKTNKIICHSFNIYYKSSTFPYSVHAEIQSISKYLKSKQTNRHKKALVIVKMSRIGIIGNSKCCLHCSRYIQNACIDLNLKKIFYSMKQTNILNELSKSDLSVETFTLSKGFLSRMA